jgi:hypothetical protein
LIPDSCKKVRICACGVEHPEENIHWIKDFLDGSSSVDVYKNLFNGTEYIIMAAPSGSYNPQWVYDCDGKFQCEDGGENAGNNKCYLPSTFWDTFYKQRILIYQQRYHPI